MDEKSLYPGAEEKPSTENTPVGVPTGYALEFGTGRLVPLTYSSSKTKSGYVSKAKRKKRGCCGGGGR